MNNLSMVTAVLMTLMTRGKVTRGYLAEKFEISERTVRRYIDAIVAAGVPVYSLFGPNGGYEISSEYQFDSVFFTPQELGRMIECLEVAQFDDEHINRVVLEKLAYLKKRNEDGQYLLNTDSIIIDAGPWGSPDLYRSKMEIIERAIERRHSLKVMYVDRYDSRTHRLFDPYYRILKEGVWYAFGWCHYREDFRLFKLARMKSILETSFPFERRECDVHKKLEGNFDEAETVDLEIEFSSTILGEIEEWLGLDAVSERGYIYVARTRVFGGRMLTDKLMSFGSSVKIIKPVSIRDEVLAECRRILKSAGELD